MTFPTPRTPVGGSIAAGGTVNRVVSLPAGIVAGDLMVVACVALIAAGAITPPAGWTLISGSWGTGTDGRGIYWKIAVGGETSATWIAANTSGSMHAAAMAFSGASGSPEYTFSDRDGSSTMDSPSITASWGLADNLFCAIHYFSDPSDFPVAYPTSYTLMQGGYSTGTTGFRVSARELASATDNPASVSAGGTLTEGKAATLVIRPLVASTAVARGGYMMG